MLPLADAAEHRLDVDHRRAVERLEIAAPGGRVPATSSTVTRCRPIGFGRCGERVAKTPGRRTAYQSPRGCTPERRPGRARSSHVSTSSSSPSAIPSSAGGDARLEHEPRLGRALVALLGRRRGVRRAATPRCPIVAQLHDRRSYRSLSRSTSSTSSPCSSTQPAEEVVDEQQVLAAVGEGFGGRGALVEPRDDVLEVLAQRRHARARDLVADEVGDQQAQQQLALERRERHRRRRPVAQRLDALVGERVARPRARAARLLARLEVAEGAPGAWARRSTASRPPSRGSGRAAPSAAGRAGRRRRARRGPGPRTRRGSAQILTYLCSIVYVATDHSL